MTVEEKIEYFYQLVGVDNVHDFRKKMSELGLPLFKQYQHSAKPIIHKQHTCRYAHACIAHIYNLHIHRQTYIQHRPNTQTYIQHIKQTAHTRHTHTHPHAPIVTGKQIGRAHV